MSLGSLIATQPLNLYLLQQPRKHPFSRESISTISTLHRLKPPATHPTPSHPKQHSPPPTPSATTIPKEDPPPSRSSSRCAQAADGSCRCRRKRKFGRPQHLKNERVKNWLRDDHGLSMSAQSLKEGKRGDGGLPGFCFLAQKLPNMDMDVPKENWNCSTTLVVCVLLSAVSPLNQREQAVILNYFMTP